MVGWILEGNPSNFEEDLIMTFAHDMGSGTRASEEFESRAIYENDWTLIGHREILGSQRARELFLVKLLHFTKKFIHDKLININSAVSPKISLY